MTLVISTDTGKRIGRISLAGGVLAASNKGTSRLVEHALRKAGGDTAAAYRALSTFSNGYLDVSEEPDDAGRPVGLAADSVTVTPAAMKPPGLPVPDDPAAISMFTAHRVNTILHQVAHATERMQAAKAAGGDLRTYHVTHIVKHLDRALGSAHEMAENLREHYPPEGAELEQVKNMVGLAVAVSPTAKAVTTAHLLETTLHELTHAQLHAQAMLKDPPAGPEWAFDADHCASHLAGAVEHAEKIFIHVHDNYPAEAKWLDGIAKITHPLEATQHTGGTISGQLDLAAIHGKHIPGTAYTFRHGWIPLIGRQLNDIYPQWKVDADTARTREATIRETKAADAIGKGHIRAAKEAAVPVAGHRRLTRQERAMIAVRDRSPAEIPARIAPAPTGAAEAAAGAFQQLLPAMPPAAPGPANIGSMHQQLQPQTIGGLHAQIEGRDPALSALAGPGASEDALAKFIDARVAAEVARQMGQITPRQSADVKGALASMHAQQQKLISLLRRSQGAEQTDDDKDLEKHTISNTLFSFAGVAVAMGSLAIGLGPVGAALVAGIIPLSNVIHDYVRNLG